MNLDLVGELDALVEAGVVSREQCARARCIAAGSLLSVREELRTLLALGVLLLTTGVGLLLTQHARTAGCILLAVILGAASWACLRWVSRRAPAFTRGPAAAGPLELEHVLLLGLLLAAGDLGFVEARWSPLGHEWPWHLLLVSLGFGAASFRFDSRVVFSVALSTFAAWRGVSLGLLERHVWGDGLDAFWANALGCGFVFLAASFVMRRAGVKVHFAPVAEWLGCLLGLGAVCAWQVRAFDVAWAFAVAGLLAGVALAAKGAAARRGGLAALGVAAAYFSLSRLVTHFLDGDVPILAWFLISALVLVVLLFYLRSGREQAT